MATKKLKQKNKALPKKTNNVQADEKRVLNRYSAYENEINDLSQKGLKLYKDLISEDKKKIFLFEYQSWYTRCHRLIEQLMPTRLTDFEFYYKDDKRKAITYPTYRLRDYLHRTVVEGLYGEAFDSNSAATNCFVQQLTIVNSIRDRLTSLLYNIKEVLLADLFDSEIDAAQELNKKGFARAAGAIVGVILEKHLKDVCLNHKIKILKKRSTIADLNNLLKENDVYDVVQWRKIQYLTDIRNKCDHHREEGPTKEDVEELISGTNKVIKTIF